MDCFEAVAEESGIGEPGYAYTGGKVIKGDDGTYHLFTSRLPLGSKAKPSKIAQLVRATSKNPCGPYRIADEIGLGGNPEIYRLKRGTIAIYTPSYFYEGDKITGPWRQRQTMKVNKCWPNGMLFPGGKASRFGSQSCVVRQDDSVLMVGNKGGIWISGDGYKNWTQMTVSDYYSGLEGTDEKSRDVEMWKTDVQYHMIAHDREGRVSYRLRSKNGLLWKTDIGSAFPRAVSDSNAVQCVDVLQDEFGRAYQASLTVKAKKEGAGSSTIICAALVKGRLMQVLNETLPGDGEEIRVLVKAEPGFNPHTDIRQAGLIFGAPEKVDAGEGCRPVGTEKSGDDLIILFKGDHGFTRDNFAGKLLGRSKNGDKLLFGYSRLPWVAYDQCMLCPSRTFLRSQSPAPTRCFLTAIAPPANR